jgi:hypothetical protein
MPDIGIQVPPKRRLGIAHEKVEWATQAVSPTNPQRTCVVLVDAEMPGDGMDVQEPKDQQHDSNQADDG